MVTDRHSKGLDDSSTKLSTENGDNPNAPVRGRAKALPFATAVTIYRRERSPYRRRCTGRVCNPTPFGVRNTPFGVSITPFGVRTR